MKKIIHFFLAFIATITIQAQVNGDVLLHETINYTITDASNNEVECSGYADPATDAIANLVIPSGFTTLSGDTYTVTAIGNGAFSGYEGTRTNRGDNATEDNRVIETVVLPSTVIEVKDHAFRELNLLTEINLDDVMSIGGNAFTLSAKLSDIGSLANLTSIGAYAFFQTDVADYVLPTAITVYPIGTAYDMDEMTEFNIPSTVADIGELFLGRNDKLESIQANWADPSSVTILEKNFLRNLYVDDSADPLVVKAGLNLYVPTGTKSLYENHALWGRFPSAQIIEGSIPAPSTALGVGDSFSEGDLSYTILSVLPNTVEVKGFSGVAIKDVNVTDMVTETVNNEVYNVVAIGVGAFSGNTAANRGAGFTTNHVIETIQLPTSVVEIKDHSMRDLPALTTVNLGNVVTTGSNIFSNSSALVNIGGDLTNLVTLGRYTFFNTAVASIVFPIVEFIGEGALRQTKIVTIDLPNSITTIENQLFRDCTQLTSFTANWTAAQLADTGNYVFSNVDPFRNLTIENINLIVPTAAVSAYQGASPWNQLLASNITDGSTLSVDGLSTDELSVSINNGTLTVVNGSDLTSVAVYDMTGRQLIAENSVSLDISNLSTGVYIVKVTNDAEELVKRFVKN